MSGTAPPDPAAQGEREEDEPERSPRAFAIGTGVILQTVGVIFTLGAFCFWGASSLLIRQSDTPEPRWTNYLMGERLPAAALTIGVATTLVGGLGMLAAGVGLQGERPSSGWVALVSTGATALVYWVLSAVLFVAAGSVVAALAAFVFALLATVLFGFSWASASLLRRFPPDAHQSAITEEFLQEYRRERRRRREQGEA